MNKFKYLDEGTRATLPMHRFGSKKWAYMLKNGKPLLGIFHQSRFDAAVWTTRRYLADCYKDVCLIHVNSQAVQTKNMMPLFRELLSELKK